MPPNLTSVAAKTLYLIFRGPNSDAQPDLILLDYRHGATFRDLWLEGLSKGTPNIAGETHDWADSTRQILIIGNDPPDGVFDTKVPALAGINFRSHFTATSWLATWLVWFPDSKVPIAVIDPREAKHAAAERRR